MSQLVFKITAGCKSFAAVDYNEDKQQKAGARLIYFENFGPLQEKNKISNTEFKSYLNKIANTNKRVKNKQIHAILSCKGQEYTHEKLKDFGLRIMDKLGYRDQPVLIYAHNDTKNNHIHIVSTRVKPNGQKIPDNFEGVRANRLLAELQSINVREYYQNDMKDALSYNLSSPAQITLLMENKGYSYKYEGNKIKFFKHGTRTGEVNRDILEKKIKKDISRRRPPQQLRALILKYKNQYKPTVHKEKTAVRTTKKQKYASPLTTFLHSRFGYEFSFFSSKNHDEPYGYSIIDHQNKTVYKGSEVLGISFFTGEVKKEMAQGQETAAATAISQTGEQSINSIFKDPEFLKTLDLIIDGALIENDKVREPHKKKKRKQDRYQRKI